MILKGNYFFWQTKKTCIVNVTRTKHLSKIAIFPKENNKNRNFKSNFFLAQDF